MLSKNRKRCHDLKIANGNVALFKGSVSLASIKSKNAPHLPFSTARNVEAMQSDSKGLEVLLHQVNSLPAADCFQNRIFENFFQVVFGVVLH